MGSGGEEMGGERERENKRERECIIYGKVHQL